MGYAATIKISDKRKLIYEVLLPDGARNSFERSKISIANSNGTTALKISANDYTAFKSTIWPALKNLDLASSLLKQTGGA